MLPKTANKNHLALRKAVETRRSDEVRDRLSELGIQEQEVADAVAWARQSL